MRREDIELRRAARGGDAQASLTIARRLFEGDGVGRNVTLGLGYLQQELQHSRPQAVDLVARCVPLEAIVTHRLQAVLAQAAQDECPQAMLKLGVWMALRVQQRAESLPWLRLSGRFDADLTPGCIADPCRFAALLGRLPAGLLDAGQVALLCAREALRVQDLASACYCLRLAREFLPPAAIAEAASQAVHLAASAQQSLDLPVALVEQALRLRSEAGDAEAQYALGCALAGIAYGHLQPGQIVRDQCRNRATGWLLRAADAGKRDAWLDLFHLAPRSGAALAGSTVARFFLEKAARTGLVDAQVRLGALLLAEASCVRTAEDALHWLAAAAAGGAAGAIDLMRTLVLPLPELPAGYEQTILERISAMDRDLGMRMTMARALHLTRHEALSFDAARQLRPWGLVLPGSAKENPKGRLAPAVTPEMQQVLSRARAFSWDSPPLGSALVVQRARAQRRVFELLCICEEQFFAGSIGRSWSHYGYGRHWAARASHALRVATTGQGSTRAAAAVS